MTDTLNLEAERAAFEKASNDARFFPRELDFTTQKSPSGKRDEYVNRSLQASWEGWLLARRSSSSVSAGEMPEPVAMVSDEFVGMGIRTGVATWRVKAPPAGTKLYTEQQLRAATKAAAPADAPKAPSAFVQHLNNSSKLVEGWPEWKRGLWAPAEDAREEVQDELIHVGAMMANTMFNLAQRTGDVIDSDLAAKFDKMRKEWDTARRASSVPAIPGTGKEAVKPQPYTCIGKGGKYLLLGTATGAGTSRDLEDLRIYIDAENPLGMYYRTVPNFDLRMAPAGDSNSLELRGIGTAPSHPSEAKAGGEA